MERGIVAIIQARMGSSRLPGKVLLEIAGQPMLAWVVQRTQRAKRVEQVVVATTIEPADDPIVDLCARCNFPVFRGSLHDVLDRYYQTAHQFQAQTIVRITADCPLIDPGLIDRTVNAFLGTIEPQDQILTEEDQQAEISQQGRTTYVASGDPTSGTTFDFAANRLPPPWGRTYPIGLDTEVCSFQALECAWKEARLDYQREHVMPYLYDHRGRFHCLLINHTRDYGALRWTVDTPQDLELVRQICARFPGREDFSWLEVLDLWQREPALAGINAQVRHKTMHEIDGRAKLDEAGA